MAKTATTRRSGQSRQRSASAKSQATSKAKPRRSSARATNGKSSASKPKTTASSRKNGTTSRKKAAAPQSRNGTSGNRIGGSKAASRGKTTTSSAAKKPRAKAGKATKGRGTNKAQPLRRTAAAVKDATPSLPSPSLPTPNKPVRKLALFAIKRAAKKTFGSVSDLAREAAENAAARTGEAIRDAADRASDVAPDVQGKPSVRRLPIQRSVDVAVPIRVAWEEWLELERLPEGVHTIKDIERDGDELVGSVAGPRNQDWEAEVLDERERQSFAWQSHNGTDCAGLITFHALSDRLTRIELNLDVVPTTPAEALQLTTRLADHRAETELRRFKARLELINPDLYEDEEETAPAGDSEDGHTVESERAEGTARSAGPDDSEPEDLEEQEPEDLADEPPEEEPSDEDELEEPEEVPEHDQVEAA